MSPALSPTSANLLALPEVDSRKQGTREQSSAGSLTLGSPTRTACLQLSDLISSSHNERKPSFLPFPAEPCQHSRQAPLY